MRRILLSFFLPLLLGALPASADFNGGAFEAAQTRFGALQVTGQRGNQRLLFNGTDLGLSDHAIEISGVWAVEGGGQDWAVITSYHGGNMCGGFVLFAVMLTAEAAARTEPFGVCRGGPVDIRVFPDAMELDVSDPAARVAYQTFRFDGQQLTQQAVLETAAPAAGAGPDVTRWLGQHPQALTQEPSEHARFAAILTPELMDDMNRRMSGPGGTEQRGDWVVGRACQAHQCNVAMAIWALRIADGRAVALFHDGGGAGPRTQTFGITQADWQDPVLRALMEDTLK